MSLEEDEQVLDAIAGRRINGVGKVRANCPFCITVVGKDDRRQCLMLRMSTGYWKCFRCETWGKLSEIPYDLSTLAQKATETKPKVAINLPDGWHPLWAPEAMQSIILKDAIRYVYAAPPVGRGVRSEVVREANIGACVKGDFQNRVVIPIYKSGALAGYVGRVWRKKGGSLPYRYSEDFDRANVLYNEQALYKKTSEPVLVVEGVFDTFPFWPNAVAVLGKMSPAQFEMIEHARRPVCFAFDGDAWRDGEAAAMALRRRNVNAQSLRLPPLTDPDEMPDWIVREARAACASQAIREETSDGVR